MPSIAGYVRYSSDRQKETSVDDQIRLLTDLATRHGWPAPEIYADAALSGTHTERPALQRLLRAAESRQVDVLLIEDLSRLSRDLGESDRLLKRLRFHGVRVLAVDGFDSDSSWSHMEAGLKGLMAEAYIQDLARRTHRGQVGTVTRGQSAGGRVYGYRSEPIIDPTGRITGYRRVIDEAEAAIVRRIFDLYTAGHSAYAIAHRLNSEGIPGPRGGTWARSAIYADKRSGVGILGNPLYRGELIWNRSRWVRAPGEKTRRRVERPESEWIRQQDESLRIITDATWDAAQHMTARNTRSTARRGTGLLTGILVCATCGANYISINRERMGCAGHKERGPSVCAQAQTVVREKAERAILDTLRQSWLLQPPAIERFCQTLARAQAAHRPDDSAARQRLRQAEQEIGNIMAAIRAGIVTESTRAGLEQAERMKREAEQEIKRVAQQQQVTGHLDPRMIYRRMVTLFEVELEGEDRREANTRLRELLGTMPVIATEDGPIAQMKTGRVLMHAAGLLSSGSGGALHLLETLEDHLIIPLR